VTAQSLIGVRNRISCARKCGCIHGRHLWIGLVQRVGDRGTLLVLVPQFY